MAAVADLGYADCTATAWRPAVPAGRARRAPRSTSPPGSCSTTAARVLELPTTHSLGAAARALHRPLPPVVHVHFHDYELLDARRRAALTAVLVLLARRRRPVGLDELDRRARGAWADVCAG